MIANRRFGTLPDPSPQLRPHVRLILPPLVLATLFGLAGLAAGGEAPKEKRQPPPAASEAPKEKRLPPPVEVGGSKLLSEGIQLSATYYAGTKGKDTVPVILLHQWKGDRKEYSELAKFLQQQGHAVLLPDLRGHGQSAQSPLGGEKVDPAKMSSDQFYLMPYSDVAALRSFLVEKNDAGELNLNKLCIVGAEMGAAVAVYYAFYDWTYPVKEGVPLRLGPRRDVKGLVLISPEWSFKGLPLSKPLGDPAVRSLISVMIIVGKEDSRALADARRIHKLLERYHADPQTVELAQRDLFLAEVPTSLQGTKILGVPKLGADMHNLIARFIELRLVNKDFPWYPRVKGE